MSSQEFVQRLKEDILDIDGDLTMDTNLEDLEEWDSLALVSFTAFAGMQGVDVERSAVRGAKTVGDLYALLGA